MLVGQRGRSKAGGKGQGSRGSSGTEQHGANSSMCMGLDLTASGKQKPHGSKRDQSSDKLFAGGLLGGRDRSSKPTFPRSSFRMSQVFGGGGSSSDSGRFIRKGYDGLGGRHTILAPPKTKYASLLGNKS
ncbi:unnamed protein product [Discosporangium mesarthrocarpum]